MISSANISTKTRVVALCRYAGINARLFHALMQHFGTLDRIIRADSGKLMAIDGIDAETANRISDAGKHINDANEHIADLERREIRLVTRFDDTYPRLLFELNDPPAMLYIRGSLPDSHQKSLAIVGTDDATHHGIELTVKVATKVAQDGVQVISSLNRGIDIATHLGSKTGGGHSFAITESGFDNPYPKENTSVAVDITTHGGIISEFGPEATYQKTNYRFANRILVGTAQAVVVTELYSDSARILDLLAFCGEIGKLSFILIDPNHGALADQNALNMAVKHGAIPMVGLNKLDDIVTALV
jgi:DNA processing protein